GVEFQSVLPPETRGDRIPPRRRCLLEVHSGSVYERSLNETLRRSSAAPHRGKTQGAPLHGPSLVRKRRVEGDRKSTRLNSSHVSISYAVFCLQKKNN